MLRRRRDKISHYNGEGGGKVRGQPRDQPDVMICVLNEGHKDEFGKLLLVDII